MTGSDADVMPMTAIDTNWVIARSRHGLDPERFLGELGELPLGDRIPGEWCEVVVSDRHGPMRWTLVVAGREPERDGFTSASFQACTGSEAEHPSEPESSGWGAAPNPETPVGRESAAGTDWHRFSRRLFPARFAGACPRLRRSGVSRVARRA